MVDLSVKIGSVTLQNPVTPASGAFSWEYNDVIDLNRLGGLVAKTICREPRLGNPTPRMAETEGGIIQSIGLPGKGIEYFVEHIVPEYARFKPPLIVSVSSESIEDFAALAHELSVPDVDVIEANISCPTRNSTGGNFAMQRGLHPRLHQGDPRQDQQAVVGEAVAERRRHRFGRQSGRGRRRGLPGHRQHVSVAENPDR